MNQHHFAVCIYKCNITDVRQGYSKNGFLNAGQLVKIVDEINNENFVISVCLTNAKNYTFTKEFYHCPKLSLKIIPVPLWQMLLPVKIAHRPTLLKHGIEYLLGLRVGMEVQISGGSIKMPGILTCVIHYIGDCLHKGNGYFFGLELIKNPNTILKEFQCSNLKGLDKKVRPMEKCFFATAEQVIIPNSLNNDNNLQNKDFRGIPEWRTSLPVTKEHVTSLKTDLDRSLLKDPELEKKTKLIQKLKEQLNALNSTNVQNFTPSVPIEKPKYYQQSPKEATTPNSTVNDIKAVNDLLAQLNVSSTNSPTTSIKNNVVQVFNSLPELNIPFENFSKFKMPDPNMPRNSRMTFLNFSKDLANIRRLNDFPLNQDDINLIQSIEMELNLLKKYYFENLTSNEDNLESTVQPKLQPPVLKPKTVSTKFKCQICFNTYMNMVRVRVDKCQHQFCKNCFKQKVIDSKTALQCPFVEKNDRNRCKTIVSESLIKENFPGDIFDTYNMKIKWDTIGNAPNGFRCKTNNCYGCWIMDIPNVTIYECPVCKLNNCIKCQALHNGINCKEYERKIIYGDDEQAKAKILENLTAEQRLIHELIHNKCVKTDKQAENALILIERHSSLEHNDIYWAVMQNNSIELAEKLLSETCGICFQELPRNRMENMIQCTDFCCRNCATEHFTERILSHSILNCVCPFCRGPKLNELEDDEISNYFVLLTPFLRRILNSETYLLFETKLRDYGLTKLDNFRWCSECSSGYIIQPQQIAVTCPTCATVTCSKCRKNWEEQHLNITCDQFADWQEKNDPEAQAKGVIDYLNGIQCIKCPQCNYKYGLAKGGCMHFICTQCRYDFCCGCNQPMRCNKYETCVGLHAHHPRNCLYYLRDYSVEELEALLTSKNIVFEKIDESNLLACKIPVQDDDGKDSICGKEVLPNHKGNCLIHYIEYLVGLINTSNIDPVSMMPLISCQQELLRNRVDLPPNEPTLQILRDTIIQNIPLQPINYIMEENASAI